MNICMNIYDICIYIIQHIWLISFGVVTDLLFFFFLFKCFRFFKISVQIGIVSMKKVGEKRRHILYMYKKDKMAYFRHLLK